MRTSGSVRNVRGNLFFVYKNVKKNRQNPKDYEAACMLPKNHFTQILLHHTLKTPENPICIHLESDMQVKEFRFVMTLG